MFQSITYVRRTDNPRLYVYRVIDSDFIGADIAVIPHLIEDGDIARRIIAIITQYRNRKLPVAGNLARFYLWYAKSAMPRAIEPNRMAFDKEDIDNAYPEVEYGTKHFDCMVRQLQQVQYGNRKR